MFYILKKLAVVFVLLGSLGGCAFMTAMTVVAAAPVLSEIEMAGNFLYWQQIGKKRFLIRPKDVKDCDLPQHIASETSIRCAKIVDGQNPLTKAEDYPGVIRNVIAHNPNMILPEPSDRKTVLVRGTTIGGIEVVLGAYFTYIPKTTVRTAFKRPS